MRRGLARIAKGRPSIRICDRLSSHSIHGRRTIHAIKYAFQTVELDGRIVAVPTEGVGNGFDGGLRLNKSALVAFERLLDGATENELLEALEQRYSAPRDVLQADLRKFLAVLEAKGLIEQ